MFSKIFFKALIIILIIFSLLSFFSSFYLNEDFFISKSSDGKLHNETIKKIHTFQSLLLILGTFSVFLILIFLLFTKSIKLFLDKYKAILQNLLLVLIVITIFILLGEIIARIILQEQFSSGSHGIGALNFYSKISLNNDGMRDRDFTLKKPDETLRIAVIGDSVTFGWGVEDVNDTYPKLLEKRLNELTDINYEVLNFGDPDADTGDELIILKEKALRYDLDILIVGYHVNDFKNVDNENVEKSFYLSIPYIGFILRSSSYLYYFFETRVNHILENIFDDPYLTKLNKRFESKVNLEYNKGIFREIAKIAEENQMQVLITNFPVLYKLDDYPITNSNEFVKEIADENNFYFIDILETFKNYDANMLIVNKYDDMHPNEFGHEIISNILYENMKNFTLKHK